MIAFTVVFDLVITAVMAALLIAMPSMVRPTLPLGVSVPLARVNDPVVRSSVRLFRWWVAAAWLFCAVLGTVVAFAAPAVTLAVVPLVFLVLSAVVYVLTRRRIVAAKRDDDWYQGVTTRLVADASPRHRAHPPIGWLLSSLVVVCVTVAVGVAVYPSLPEVIPTHWDGAGHVDATAHKSVWSVFALPLIALAIAGAFYGLSWVGTVGFGRRVASDTAEQASRRVEAQRQLATTGLGMMSLALSLGLGFTAVASWLAPASQGVMLAAVVTTVVLIFVALGVIIVRYARAVARVNAVARDGVTVGRGAAADAETPVGPARSPARAEAPDDDRFWKLGAVYLNRDDPATFVPKRFGVGWTINLASPGGIAFAAVTMLVVVAAIVAAVVASTAN